jgi:unsaturated rhamnogalacturonyl hydrolase
MNRLIWFLIILIAFSNCKTSSTTAIKLHSLSLDYAMKMADADILRNPDPRFLDFRPQPKWEYTNGLICSAMMQLWKETGNKKYFDYAKFYADSMIMENATIITYKKTDYNIDRINPGKFLIDLYAETKIIKYKMAIDTLRDQMRQHPRTSEGGFWHKKVYPHQMWLDGLYMGTPFLTKYAHFYDESKLYDDVANQIFLMDKNAFDSNTGLYFHGWDESKLQKWASPTTGQSPHIWGRAMGWFAMALVDNLEYFPDNHPKKKMIINIIQKLVTGITKYQDPKTGLWSQIVDMPNREGNYLEASASAMFTYTLFKAINLGYLDKKTYSSMALKAYNGILTNLIKTDDKGNISLTNVCAVAGLGGTPYRDGSYEYYINETKRDDDPKGVGPFILASLECHKFSKP